MGAADDYLILSEGIRILRGILPDDVLTELELRGVRLIARRVKQEKLLNLSPKLGVAMAAGTQGMSRSWGYKQLHAARKLSTETADE